MAEHNGNSSTNTANNAANTRVLPRSGVWWWFWRGESWQFLDWYCFLEHKFFFCLTGRHSVSLTRWRKHKFVQHGWEDGPGLLQLGWHRQPQHP
uniref:Uncharacterized protein n=1 Tax=Ficedula albicollis TaxID=59894 RepID=A0A803WBY7_FICAL